VFGNSTFTCFAYAGGALVQSQGLGVIMMRYLLRIEPFASMDFGTIRTPGANAQIRQAP
jgi:hypothetical protein